ncbi:hypothetical protein ACK33Q_03495 [Aeromonas veronii]
MSLLAALAKGFGAGTINNAKAGFAEQQRLREAAQRKEEMTTELTAAETRLQKNIDAGKADTETRLAAQSSENAKQREHDLAMFQKQLASAAATANANADARYRETNAKNAIGRLSAIAKQKSEIMAMPDDKISPEQRDQAIAMHDMMGYMIASDPNVQQLVSEYGGAGELQYWLSLGPGADTNGDGSNSGTGAAAPEALRRVPEPTAPMRRTFGDARDGVNTKASAAFSNENLKGVLGEAERRAKINVELQKRARTYQDGALSSNPAMSSFAGMQK